MQVDQIATGLLKAADYNPRQMTEKQHKDLTESLKRFGLVEPLVVNKHKGRENVVVGGHQRLAVARELGLGAVPVVFVDLPLSKEKELNVRLNRNMGEWDFDKLANEFDMPELLDFGFEEKELLGHFEPEVDDFDADKVAGEIKEPESKRGEVYELGRHRLMCGDATSKEDVEKLMDGKKADMVFTDPPYGISYDVDFTKRGTGSPTPGRKRHTAFAKKYRPIIGDGDYSPEHILQHFGYCQDIFIWGANYFWEHLPNGKTSGLYVWHKNAKIKNTNDAFEVCWSKQKRAREIVDITWMGAFGSDEGAAGHTRVHPTQKPIKLASWFFKFCKVEGYVVDLFAGSGSTLIACEQTNRTCYAMEIDPIYVDVIRKRYADYIVKSSKNEK
jgi:DNA modification methylase